MKTCGIYQITCIPNGKRYIGSSIRIPERWRQHRSDLKAGRHPNIHLQRCWDKYGEAEFSWEILEEAPEEKLFEIEQEYLDEIQPKLNNSPNATAPMRGRKMSAEAKAKISRALKGRVSNRKGVKLTVEQRQRISRGLVGNTYRRGKKASVETRAKMRISQQKRRKREACDGQS